MGVSIKEVAARAGVSVGTVSNVLNRPDMVKAETVEKVHAAIDELGYVPNSAAQQLREGQSRSIGLVALDINNPFFTDVARGAERAAALGRHTVLLANSGESIEREISNIEMFERQRVRGVLVSPLSEDLSRLRDVRKRGIPVVLVDRGTEDTSFPSVAVDDVAGGELAARHLLEGGRRRLAFVGGPMRIRQIIDRYRGAAAAVAAVDEATITSIETEALSLDEGMRVGGELRALVARGEIDAVFAANDLLAIGVQQGLLGGDDPVAIPGDVALVGYDDISFAAAAVVPITSVRQPRELIGETAVALLEEVRESESEPRHVVFEPELVVRSSSAPAPTA
ncbi:LacI family DNA-binding transcriptional regulator [Demequina zhanjiangensis]|uniref:LacI family DNA-binding transcriptional regulator n=1 Tax=Demequina zhanjiangensis TaxID=3051659 RepID=A0ABT8FXV9_9MICO|nr:LacI family DNA-binding transcriptional regulator [Demequina sp. SYSU T00b26]MDN4471736.1 LacI family DNA-binding transcriptional regulator [Demequina sp. SYSU T00b26]